MARSRTHVGKDDRRATFEVIDEGIEPRRRMYVDFGDRAIEEMLQGSASLVLRIEIKQCDRNLVRFKPLRKASMKPVFPTPPLPPIVKTTRLQAVIVPLPAL